jgi:ElaB/YqjD/DUF883 family membrane-anchored ribosome-binding protein
MSDAPKDYAPGDNPLEPNEAVRSARDKAAETAAQLRRTVEERTAAAKHWAADQSEVIREQVVERPLIAVGVSAGAAFAAGLVLGVLLASRR